MTHDEELREEQQRLRKLRLLVDVTAQLLAEDDHLILCEALRLIDAARTAAVRLFPEKCDTFDLVVRPRLERIVFERFGIAAQGPLN
jgi:hypothetical protein